MEHYFQAMQQNYYHREKYTRLVSVLVKDMAPSSIDCLYLLLTYSINFSYRLLINSKKCNISRYEFAQLISLY